MLSRANLALQFEAISNMPDEARRIVKALLDGMISNYQAKQMIVSLSSKRPAGFSLAAEERSRPGTRA